MGRLILLLVVMAFSSPTWKAKIDRQKGEKGEPPPPNQNCSNSNEHTSPSALSSSATPQHLFLTALLGLTIRSHAPPTHPPASSCGLPVFVYISIILCPTPGENHLCIHLNETSQPTFPPLLRSNQEAPPPTRNAGFVSQLHPLKSPTHPTYIKIQFLSF